MNEISDSWTVSGSKWIYIWFGFDKKPFVSNDKNGFILILVISYFASELDIGMNW